MSVCIIISTLIYIALCRISFSVRRVVFNARTLISSQKSGDRFIMWSGRSDDKHSTLNIGINRDMDNLGHFFASIFSNYVAFHYAAVSLKLRPAFLHYSLLYLSYYKMLKSFNLPLQI